MLRPVRLLAPSLAVIAASGLCAAENLAPIITVPVTPDSVDINSGYPVDEDDTAASVTYSLATVQTNIWDFDPLLDPADFVLAAGIAVTQADGGVWEYSEEPFPTEGTGSWVTISGASSSTPFTLQLLGAPDPTLRFTPADTNFNGTATLRWRAWDDSDASGPYTTIAASYVGGDSPLSGDDRGFEISVSPVNDRPTAIASLITGFGGAPGETVETTAGQLASDASGQDVDGDELGIVIVGQNTDDPGLTWEWFNGEVWEPIVGTSSNNALPLSAGTQIRVNIPGNAQPQTTLHGLSYRVWDGTYGSSGVAFDLAGDEAGWESTDDWAWSDASTLDIEVRLSTNQAPLITSEPDSQTIISGRALSLAFAGSDPDGDSTELTWNISGTIGGTNYAESLTGSSPEFTPTAGNAGSGSLTVTVSDGTDTASTTISVTVVANQAPVVTSADPGTVAIAGQPWEALIAVTDGNAGDLALLQSGVGGGTKPAWMTVSSYTGNGRWKISGTPANGDIDTTATFNFSVSDPSYPADSSARVAVSFSVTVLADSVQEVSGPTVPVSSPGNVTYASIHPGSSSNISALSSALAVSGRQRARGFWWSPNSGSFGELPASPSDPVSAGIFVASLDALNVTYDAPVRAAPFAITLPANSWSFIGIPPIQLDPTGSPVTSHAWDDFRLETTAGAPASESTVLSVLAGTSNLSDIQPWSWDGTAYSRVSTLQTGTAYWVRNRSGTAYRLVRASNGANGTFGTMGSQPLGAPVVAAMAASRASAAVDTPPAPPSGLVAPVRPPAEQGGGNCGGGLAGLLLAGLTLIGLRRRRI